MLLLTALNIGGLGFLDSSAAADSLRVPTDLPGSTCRRHWEPCYSDGQKKTRDRQRNPATGRRKTALGLDQAGPRLPVPTNPIGTRTACFRHNPGTANENEREGRSTLSATADAATTVRLRIGRTRFHNDAFIPVRLVTADGNFVKRRVQLLPIFYARNSIFPGIRPRRRDSAALRSQYVLRMYSRDENRRAFAMRSMDLGVPSSSR